MTDEFTQEELQKAVANRKIRIRPKPADDQFGPTSIDLHLGRKIYLPRAKSKGISVSIKENAEEVLETIWIGKRHPKDAGGNQLPLAIEPGQLVLAQTLEKILSRKTSLA